MCYSSWHDHTHWSHPLDWWPAIAPSSCMPVVKWRLMNGYRFLIGGWNRYFFTSSLYSIRHGKSGWRDGVALGGGSVLYLKDYFTICSNSRSPNLYLNKTLHLSHVLIIHHNNILSNTKLYITINIIFIMYRIRVNRIRVNQQLKNWKMTLHKGLKLTEVLYIIMSG